LLHFKGIAEIHSLCSLRIAADKRLRCFAPSPKLPLATLLSTNRYTQFHTSDKIYICLTKRKKNCIIIYNFIYLKGENMDSIQKFQDLLKRLFQFLVFCPVYFCKNFFYVAKVIQRSYWLRR